MTAQFARGSYPARSAAQAHEPHAALLIDFDNVTMGIRSDLTKELKSLLNSDIIKGKVAVQRAYADWRRYPQYIVPLAEASVDLIFAPAYGSSKKNATDIRLAIDALELVFTRSEIGTFILLSGDSDFSSLVLKLKEYGKYVIGVGIRESASDLLVQNCDEYYSYSALTGLTRAGDEVAMAGYDPWELVEIAVRQMVTDGDVMRSDRLKQIILQLDPNFDEKTLGFSKFNRFVQEAANRGLLRLHKMENGQFEIALPDGEAAPEAPRTEEERTDGRRGRGRRGRGRRDAEGGARETAAREGAVTEREPGTAAPATEPTERAARPEPAREEPTLRAQPVGPEREVASLAGAPAELKPAYELLRRAAADVARDSGGVARDSDVKRRMIELQIDWDESTLGFSKFSRFLRQAHDADVINLRRLENGNYEIVAGSDIESAGRSDAAAWVPEQVDGAARPGRRDRQRGGGRPAREPRAPRERAAGPEVPTAAAPPETAAAESAKATKEERPARAEQPRPVAAVAAAASAAPVERAPATPMSARGLGLRRGSSARPQVAAPPPLLPGQTVGPRKAPEPPPAASVAVTEPLPVSAPPAEKRAPRRAPARRATAKAESEPAPQRAARGGRGTRTTDAPAKIAASAPALGLPTEEGAVIDYLATNYKGVGRKSGELLVDAFGAGKVFDALQTQPDRVKEALGVRRGETLLEAWRADHAARMAVAPRPNGESPAGAAQDDDEQGGDRRKGRRSRGRRGGRKRAAAPKAT